LYGITAIEVNHIARAKNKDVCVIVLSDLSTVDIAQKAVKEGAFDYVLKPQDIEKVESLIKLYAISKK
jgi:DNA-binding NtrC family response regulator